MNTSVDASELWQRLVARDIVRGDLPVAKTDSTAWYLRVLVGFAGWLAAVFVLSAMGALIYELLRSPPGPLLLGAALCCVGTWLIRRDAERLFLAQSGLALVLAGEALVAYGIVRALDGHAGLQAPAWLAVAVFEIVMVRVVPHPAHRALAALFAVAALLAAAWEWRAVALFAPGAAVVFVALAFTAADKPDRQQVLEPASTGVALALLLLTPAVLLGGEGLFRQTGSHHDLVGRWAQVLTAATVVGTVGLVLRRYPGATFAVGFGGLLAAAAFALAAWVVPGLSATLLVVIVAFALGRPVLCGLGLVATLAMLSHYYYSLETGLLTKSLSLMAAGVVLLTVGVLLMRYYRKEPESGDD